MRSLHRFVNTKSSSHLIGNCKPGKKSVFCRFFRGLLVVGTDLEEGNSQFPPDAGQFPPDGGGLTFAERLRIAREAAGFRSARALSEAIEVSDSNIRLYEKGEQEPKMSVLSKLAAACKVSIDWLANGEGPMECLPVGATTKEGHLVVQGPVMPLINDPLTLFSSVNMDRLGEALAAADTLFEIQGKSPTPRERAQVQALMYDMMTREAERKRPSAPDIVGQNENKSAGP